MIYTVSVELNFPVELNSFSDASRVCEPANENLFLVTCRFRRNTELFSLVNKQSIVLRSTSCGFYFILIAKWRRRRAKWLRKTIDCSLKDESSSVFLRNLQVTKNRLSFAGSQTLLASENGFNSTGNFNSTETVGDARRLRRNFFEKKLGKPVESACRLETISTACNNCFSQQYQCIGTQSRQCKTELARYCTEAES